MNSELRRRVHEIMNEASMARTDECRSALKETIISSDIQVLAENYFRQFIGTSDLDRMTDAQLMQAAKYVKIIVQLLSRESDPLDIAQ